MKLRFALLFILIAIALHVYLTQHYYNLSFGLGASESICNVSARFSCDTVSASGFSTLAGIPVAAWGAAANLILLVLVFGWLVGWADNVPQLGRYAFYLSVLIALASIVMGSISMFYIGSFCLFCMGAYLCSFITFELLRRSLEERKLPLPADLRRLVGENKVYGIFFLAIPVLSFMFNQAVLASMGGGNINQIINDSVAAWKVAPELSFPVEPSLVKGASDENAKMVIVEFADFRCSHCRTAAPTVKAFVSAHSDVQFRFYNFPLDGACNPVIGSGDGISCLFAKAVTCAEKVGQKGWEMSDMIFSSQDQRVATVASAKERVSGFVQTLGLETSGFDSCIDAPETDALIRKQAELGKEVGVKGTPTFYVNKKKLNRAQALPVLKQAYELSAQ